MMYPAHDTRVTPTAAESRSSKRRPDDGEVAHASHGVIFREILAFETHAICGDGSPEGSWRLDYKHSPADLTSSIALIEVADLGA